MPLSESVSNSFSAPTLIVSVNVEPILTASFTLLAELLTGGDRNRERIRRLAKFLNMYGGVCLLDCLSQTDVIRVLSDELNRTLASEPKKPEPSKKGAGKAQA
jgi:hypothetical protein